MSAASSRLACLLLACAGSLLGCAPSPPPASRVQPPALPDWQGIWEVEGITVTAGGWITETLAEVRSTFAPSLPALTAEGNKQLEAVKAQARSDPNGLQSTQGACGFGFPLVMMESPLMFEALITPRQTALVFSGREIRAIHTDGRGHPAPEDLFPTFWGHSIGHWEGDTLIIDTVGVQSPVVPPSVPVVPIFLWAADNAGEILVLLSNQAHYAERMQLLADGRLENRITIDDPATLTAPWTLTMHYRRATGLDYIIHEDCAGNDRNPVVNGLYTFKHQ